MDGVALEVVLEHEIAVATLGFGTGKADVYRLLVARRNHLMAGAGDATDRYTGVKVNRQIEVVSRFAFGIRLRGVAVVLALRTVHVARPDDGGVDEAVRPAGGHQYLRVLQFHLHRITRQDVGHVHLKNVRPVLFEQGGTLAFRLSLFVSFPRFGLALNVPHDAPVADDHRHAVDR